MRARLTFARAPGVPIVTNRMANPLPPFQAFLDEHRGPVLAFLRSMVGPHDADDCFQETFISAMRAYETLDGKHPRAWVMTIARRKAIDHHRARAAPPGAARAPARAARHRGDSGRLRRGGRALGAGRRVAAEAAPGRRPALRRGPRVRGRRPRARMLRGGSAAQRARGAEAAAREPRGRTGGSMSTQAAIERALRAGAGAPAAEVDEAVAGLARRADEEGLVEVGYGSVDSPLGKMLVASTELGLVRVILPREDFDSALERLAADVSPRLLELPGRVERARRELDEYFGGERREFDLELDRRLIRGEFTDSVLKNVQRGSVRAGHHLRGGRVSGRKPQGVPGGGQCAGFEPDPDRDPVPPRRADGQRPRGLRRRPRDEGVPPAPRGVAGLDG